MPRHARLDAPDVLHHIIIRGIERRLIFRDNIDRERFVARMEKVNGNSTLYFGEAYEVRNGAEVIHLFTGSRRVVSVKLDGTERYYHPDHLGSASVVTDASGVTIETIDYFPFGTYAGTNQNPQANYTFTDQEDDDETGLYNYDARLYDPVLGRFISADSIVPEPGNLQAFNRYSYVLNNPLVYTDPSGHGNFFSDTWKEMVRSNYTVNHQWLGIDQISVGAGYYGIYGQVTISYQDGGTDIGAGIGVGAGCSVGVSTSSFDIGGGSSIYLIGGYDTRYGSFTSGGYSSGTWGVNGTYYSSGEYQVGAGVGYGFSGGGGVGVGVSYSSCGGVSVSAGVGSGKYGGVGYTYNINSGTGRVGFTVPDNPKAAWDGLKVAYQDFAAKLQSMFSGSGQRFAFMFGVDTFLDNPTVEYIPRDWGTESIIPRVGRGLAPKIEPRLRWYEPWLPPGGNPGPLDHFHLHHEEGPPIAHFEINRLAVERHKQSIASIAGLAT